VKINLFGLGIQSRSKAVANARLQNVYIENRPMGEKSEVVAYGIPGLDLFSDAGDTPWRGHIPVETTNFFYGVHRGTLYKVDNSGTRTSLGSLNTTSGRVGMAHDGDVILIVDGTNGYTYKISTSTFAQIADPDFLNGAKTCAWLDQLFIVEDGTEFATSPDGAAWDATERAVAESSPDGIQRVISDHGELNVLGPISTEYWVTTPAVDFAFQPIKSAAAEWGCAAPWSVCKANDSLTWLGKNSDGQVSVVRLNGHVPQVISTPDLDQIINAYASVSDATGLAYKIGGHPFYQLNFPSADASWLFDGLSNRWTPIKSAGMGRHRAEIGIQYLSRTIVSDSSNGRLYKLNPSTLTENGSDRGRDDFGDGAGAGWRALPGRSAAAGHGNRRRCDERAGCHSPGDARRVAGWRKHLRLGDVGQRWRARQIQDARRVAPARHLRSMDLQDPSDRPDQEGLRLGLRESAGLMPNDLISAPPTRHPVSDDSARRARGRHGSGKPLRCSSHSGSRGPRHSALRTVCGLDFF
jgi:hypothetical protein